MDIEAYRGKCIDIVEIKDGDVSEAALIGMLFFFSFTSGASCSKDD